MISQLFPSILKNSYSDKFHDECGVFGIYSPHKVDTFSLIQFGLFALQHRGQEACGFSVLRDGFIISHKSEGLVLDFFRKISNSECYNGNAVIGHTRYSTEGGQSKKNIQPFFGENSDGRSTISIVHNGNLVNAQSIRKKLESEGVNFISEYSDSEVILRLIQKYLLESNNSLEKAIQKTTLDIMGAYSVIVLMNNQMAAFRDPNGIRPLCYGMLNEKTYIFSSETCGIDSVDGFYIRDLFPGEIIIVDQKSIRFSMLTEKKYTKKRICSFEYIYFSRPDSLIENINVYEIREKSGEKLYEQHPVEADVVIGVPDSGVPAAIGYSKASGIPFKPILVKNKYIGRSFILPKQEMREKMVNLKLNPILDEIKEKRIVIIDDSIVRGTTSRRLVYILRKAGAKEIHFRSASPPIIAPCYLGVDTPSKKDLISYNHIDQKNIAKILDVDSLEFLSMANLVNILGGSHYCFGCFTGNYPVKKYNNKL
ncbi:amidophosphoribosyltransferase [Blattabacterium sp. (Blattella germanica) str. Bge]|uniref:amidophosphoribosyltransferase n=1 Tax=Blattabacterium sp. (Blattella germanica) TaxID=624186 RepID=UPI0001BB6220|nr:amidophosphoribosyltransferase [Blattabacterium sp. (Blattella germanica)]ACY40490.1 amidophosphoribosyltransferase [Blattabacterium sp. (Blattella germanica) str. Bge]